MALTLEAATRKDSNTRATLEHRHFATIAAILASIRNTVPDINAELHDVLATEFAHELKDTNPRFDRARFLRACGVEG